MKQTPLWQLVNKSLSKQENLQEYVLFLKMNRRKHHKNESINYKLLCLRILILIIFYQSHLITQSYFTIAYFALKMLLTFKITCEIKQIPQVLVMLIAFHVLDYFTKLIPFVNYVCLFVNSLYFLAGIDQKYLALNLLMLDISALNKSLIAILLGIGKIKKPTKYTPLMLYIDIAAMIAFGQLANILPVITMTLITQIVKLIDKRLLHMKKNYSHIHQLPYVEQYH